MQIREGENFLIIEVAERVPAGLPMSGDACFTVTYAAEGFSGAGTTWVDLHTLEGFAEQLRALELSRQGEAVIESLSPRQFELRVWATDGLGHMAIKGRLMHREQVGEFSFAFDPGLLRRASEDIAAILANGA